MKISRISDLQVDLLIVLGARLRAMYPLVPLYANQGLGIALFSYDGKLFWGLNADYDAFRFDTEILVGDDTYAMAYVILSTTIGDTVTDEPLSLAVKVQDGKIVWSRQLDG